VIRHNSVQIHLEIGYPYLLSPAQPDEWQIGNSASWSKTHCGRRQDFGLSTSSQLNPTISVITSSATSGGNTMNGLRKTLVFMALE
jgi:hypothetical protein